MHEQTPSTHPGERLDSISANPPATAPGGQIAHADAVAHLKRLKRRLYRVGERAWCLVGNGLSNQTFVEGPEGIIAVDTGECVEEMRSALKALRARTDKPVVACIYTHFHYVSGTQAILEERGDRDVAIYGHAGIEANRARFGGEVSPASSRGLVHQFGVMLDDSGADGLLHCGLGRFFRNPKHAPYTAGYIPAQHTIDSPAEFTIAGLTVQLTPAPSDSTDSITIWFPELKLAVNNLVWPALYNIFAIRGEEYRDPRVLLKGLDHLSSLKPKALIGTHGPPLEGEAIQSAVTDYRDSIQYIWDQTVRACNQGLTASEAAHQVRLPERFERSYFTRQFYGLVEHHVRQVYQGLFGWFDGDESHLFPLATEDHNARLIQGFGGRDKVRAQCDRALGEQDLRWALQLATWLVRSPDSSPEDRRRLAGALRTVARQTPAANIRNWSLTRARALEGDLDLSRFNHHRFSRSEVLGAPPIRFIPVLRVLLNPDRARGVEGELAWHFPGGARAGLRLRGQVAIPTTGEHAEMALGMSHETWARILSAELNCSDAIEQGVVSVQGESGQVMRFLECFDHAAFR